MILAAGEAIVDLVPAVLADGGTGYRAVPGGAALNLARAVAALGMPAGLMCPLSSDPWGKLLRAAAGAAGVDLSLCPATGRPTTLAVVAEGAGGPSFTFHDEGSAMRGLAPADLPVLPAAVRAVVAGGISLVPEPCGTAFAAFLAQARGRAATVLDANIRPALIADAAAHRARLFALMAGADVVKLSDEDARWLWGTGTPEDWAAAARARGAGLVLVTRGAEGAVAVGDAGAVTVPAPAVTVADTVGAGDAFLAAGLVGLDAAGALAPAAPRRLDQAALAKVLRMATAAGALACTRAGAFAPDRAAVVALAGG